MRNNLKPGSTTILTDLIDDLRDQRCVLLIGPEIMQAGGRPIVRYVHEALQEQMGEEVVYYYRQDSLFLFRDENAKLSAPRLIKRIYRNIQPEEAIFRRILELPFPLVVSLNPDTFLADAASPEKFGVPHYFRYFRFSGEAGDDAPEPDRDHPLIYNLCGCISEDESLVLDYEDLFRFLRAALGPDGLPDAVRRKLREARSFLFLGFDFEKWYSQLLLQLLTGERRGRPKFAVSTEVADSDARNFLLHQFRVEFLGNDQAFFDLLYERCAKEGMLRELRRPLSIPADLVGELKARIGRNELREALDALERATAGTSLHDQVILLAGRYEDWNRRHHGGSLYPQESEVTLNRLREDLLQLINRLL